MFLVQVLVYLIITTIKVKVNTIIQKNDKNRKINILRDSRTNLRNIFRAEIGPKLAKGHNNSLDLLAIAYNELLMNQPNSMDALERSEMLNYHYQVVENYGLNNQVILKK